MHTHTHEPFPSHKEHLRAFITHSLWWALPGFLHTETDLPGMVCLGSGDGLVVHPPCDPISSGTAEPTRLHGFQHKQTVVPYANTVISLTHHANIWGISCVLLHKQDLIQSSQLSTWVSPLFVSFSVGRWNNLLGRTHLANDWSQIQKTRCGNKPEKLTCPTPTNHWTQTRSTDALITGVTQHANWRGL